MDGYVLASFSYKKHTVQLTKRTNGRSSGLIKQYFGGNSSSSKGVGILLNNNFNFEIIKYKADVNGRFVIIDIKIENQLHVRPEQ